MECQGSQGPCAKPEHFVGSLELYVPSWPIELRPAAHRSPRHGVRKLTRHVGAGRSMQNTDVASQHDDPLLRGQVEVAQSNPSSRLLRIIKAVCHHSCCSVQQVFTIRASMRPMLQEPSVNEHLRSSCLPGFLLHDSQAFGHACHCWEADRHPDNHKGLGV